jgi:Zn-dependent protease
MPPEIKSRDDSLAPRRRGRHVALPLVLLLATCLSTFWAGAAAWKPIVHLENFYWVLSQNLPQGSPIAALRQAWAVTQADLRQGLIYMCLVMGLLLAHEMGHFLVAVRNRIPASLPYFIPLPVIPFGTLGAVIGMEGYRANRRQLFDLGVAGPLAGLLVALPAVWIGIRLLPVAPLPGEGFCFHNPLLLKWMIAWLRPDYPAPALLYLNQFNPFLMAGWVAMLLTGLNMLPVSQLDGGHVAYALLGRWARLLARLVVAAAVVYMVVTGSYFWLVMLVLVILLGADHPPTADDGCRLGWARLLLGWAALLIPLLCFPPLGITPVGP